MFYSPTKQFVRFSSYRLSQIKDLKDRIHRQKVTYDQINSTQMRLQKLKRHYELLQGQSVNNHMIQHDELKQVFRNSQNAIDELMQQKISYQRSIKIKSQEVNNLQQIKNDYQVKGGVIQERLRLLIQQKDQLYQQKMRNDEFILGLDKEYQEYVRQCQKQRQIKEEIKQTEVDLQKKWKIYEEQHTKTKSADVQISHKVQITRQELLRLHQQADLFAKQTQKNEILIQKIKLQKQLISLKIQSIQANQSKYFQNTTISTEQTSTDNILQQINNKMLQQIKNIQLEQLHCQKQLKKLIQKVQKQQQQKCKWQQKLQKTKINLNLIKQKNQNLKNKLNFIFKNDSELIKTITSKKVYPNCKPQLIDVLKNSIMEPMEFKENIEVLTSKDKVQKKVGKRSNEFERIL